MYLVLDLGFGPPDLGGLARLLQSAPPLEKSPSSKHTLQHTKNETMGSLENVIYKQRLFHISLYFLKGLKHVKRHGG